MPRYSIDFIIAIVHNFKLLINIFLIISALLFFNHYDFVSFCKDIIIKDQTGLR